MSDPVHRIEILIEPGFVPVELASIADVLRVANRIAFDDVFGCTVTTTGGHGRIEGMGGLSAQAGKADAKVEPHDALIVCGGPQVSGAFAAIQTHIMGYKRAARPVILLSDAGTEWILRHRGQGAMATHWESLTWMNEVHPDLQLNARLYDHVAKVTTAAGMLGTADVVLRLVASMESEMLATDVSRALVMERIREAETPQWRTDLAIERPFAPKLAAAISLMEQNIENPLTMAEIAQQTGISVRQAERHFRRHTGLSPMAYYRRMRVRRGHILLKQTGLAITEIALACGFTSHSNFTARYRDEFGITPTDFRRSLS